MLLIASLLTVGRPLHAQDNIVPGLISFNVSLPEATLVQGGTVQVAFILDATNYSFVEHPTVDGAIFQKNSFQTGEASATVHRLVGIYSYKLVAAGDLVIHPMKVKVSDHIVSSPETVIHVEENPNYGQEWTTARSFLRARGVTDANSILEYKFHTETMMAFSDDRNRNFAIVANREYAKYLDHPVLAYGLDSFMWSGETGGDDDTIYHILDQYEAQLQYLARHSEKYNSLRPSSYTPRPEGVAPLLGGINYGQSAPYNKFFPEETGSLGRMVHCLAGCGPVALAQVLAYHGSRLAPTGTDVITSQSGKRYKVNMGDFPFTFGGGEDDVASLMMCCAATVGAEIGPTATSSSLANFKSGLIDHWTYDPCCTYISGHYDFNMLALIYKELDEARPVIVADENHLFVCDGYLGDFLHLNLGWKGYCNGYYRSVIVPSIKVNQLFFKEILIGVRPLAAYREATVHVQTPGTLGKLLSEENQRTLTSLTVTGTIDGEDIKVLRKMAGAIYLNFYEDRHGSLMLLDLSGAQIQGGKYYLTRSASGMTFTGSFTKGSQSWSYKYDMDNLTPSQWTEMQKLEVNKGDTYYVHKGSDGEYYISYIGEDNVIGDLMFSDCSNLREIILPSTTVRIGDYAFQRCRSLRRIVNRPTSIGREITRGTRWM